MNLDLSLDGELARFVESAISTGRYASSSDVVREALRLMQNAERQDADRLRSLRAVWSDGVESGDAGEIDFAALKAEARERHAALKA